MKRKLVENWFDLVIQSALTFFSRLLLWSSWSTTILINNARYNSTESQNTKNASLTYENEPSGDVGCIELLSGVLWNYYSS